MLIALAATNATAGTSVDNSVTIDQDYLIALGNMKAARKSANEIESIGCGTRTQGITEGIGEAYSWGFCNATLPNDVSAYCYTEDPALINEINSLTDYAFVVFAWEENGDCSYIGNSTQSIYLPGRGYKDDDQNKTSE